MTLESYGSHFMPFVTNPLAITYCLKYNLNINKEREREGVSVYVCFEVY